MNSLEEKLIALENFGQQQSNVIVEVKETCMDSLSAVSEKLKESVNTIRNELRTISRF